MKLSLLTATVSEIIQALFKIDKLPYIDWHPALEREGVFYQSSICDELADSLKISPASIAHAIQPKLSEKLKCAVETDNRGYIYVDIAGLFVDQGFIDFQSPLSTLIYLQPATRAFTLYDCKLLSQFALQLELLRSENANVRIYIPAPSEDAPQLFNGSEFYGHSGFLNLLELLKARQHAPALADLEGFQSVASEDPSQSVVLWLSSELLSLPNVADSLSALSKAFSRAHSFNLRLTRMESLKEDNVSDELVAAFGKYGLLSLIYLIELRHPLDLDWDVPALKNWLSMKWLASSLGERFTILDRNRLLKQAQNNRSDPGLSSDNRLHFLLSQLSYMQQRAAYLGDSAGYVSQLRQLLTGLQVAINKNRYEMLSGLNIPASFTQKISSIIERF